MVRECIRAAAEGPFYPEWEFGILFGLERREVQAVLARWPDIDDSDEIIYAVISNSTNNLLIYPIDNPDRWSAYVSVGPKDVARIFAAWRGNVPSSPIDGLC
ncbi:MAG: hypothetical protein MnENMB40S_38760 [Rhizobiaceae bacterium MnEN-MB40S]|nr:MAG: hypothetical protein MnENMB40S_38760 [Rhizobiaceae bacterium MnEN-MB40S]